MKKVFLLLALIFFVAAAAYGQNTVEAYNISILAGRSSALAIVDGSGQDARFLSITSMWGDGVNLYVADAATIRRVELATARVTTLSRTAGTGIHRSSSIGFAYNYAGLYGLWSDGSSVYGTDIGAGTIRKIDLTTGGCRIFLCSSMKLHSRDRVPLDNTWCEFRAPVRQFPLSVSSAVTTREENS